MIENLQDWSFCKAYPKAMPEWGHWKVHHTGSGEGGQ